MGKWFVELLARRKWMALAAIAVIAALTLDLVAIAPAAVSFGVAVTGAIGWCRWLDARAGR